MGGKKGTIEKVPHLLPTVRYGTVRYRVFDVSGSHIHHITSIAEQDDFVG